MKATRTQSRPLFFFLSKLLATCLCFGSVLLMPLARAQSAATGAVSGQVTDEQNAAIGGAADRLTDLATDAMQGATRNGAGRYEFVNIPPGKYDLTVSKPGFSQAKVSGQTVQVGRDRTAASVERAVLEYDVYCSALNICPPGLSAGR